MCVHSHEERICRGGFQVSKDILICVRK